MKAILHCLLVVFFTYVALPSCMHTTILSNKNDDNKIEGLIIKGEKLKNSDADSSIIIAKKLSGAANLSGNKVALVYSELFTANYFWLTGNHKTSMETVVNCLGVAEKWNIKRIYPEIYGLIANLHKENSNYKLAFEDEEKGLHWAQVNKDTAEIIAFLSLKAMLIHSFGMLKHIALNDSSINIQLKALKIAESDVRFAPLCTRFYDNMSQYYLDNKDYENAIYYGRKGVSNALKYNQQRSLTYSYAWIGMAYYYKKDTTQGLTYLYKSLTLTRALKEPYRQMEIYNHLYDCYYFSGNYKKAITLQRISEKMYDSLQVRVNEKQISELQIKYESAKKDKELALLDHSEKVKNNQIAASLFGGLLFIILLVILYYQNRTIRRNNRLILKNSDKKDEALENIAFIQAHELRKPLASIMGLINVIKTMDDIDRECILKLEEASKELDEKIHSVIAHVENQN